MNFSFLSRSSKETNSVEVIAPPSGVAWARLKKAEAMLKTRKSKDLDKNNEAKKGGTFPRKNLQNSRSFSFGDESKEIDENDNVKINTLSKKIHKENVLIERKSRALIDITNNLSKKVFYEDKSFDLAGSKSNENLVPTSLLNKVKLKINMDKPRKKITQNYEKVHYTSNKNQKLTFLCFKDKDLDVPAKYSDKIISHRVDNDCQTDDEQIYVAVKNMFISLRTAAEERK